jgi:outer membrane protein TolC
MRAINILLIAVLLSISLFQYGAERLMTSKIETDNTNRLLISSLYREAFAIEEVTVRKEAYELAEQISKDGVLDSTELLNIQDQLAQAENKRTQAQFEVENLRKSVSK